MSTQVDTFFSDLDGGVFEQQLSRMLSEVAGAVIDHGKMGKVSIELSIKQIGTSYQVQIDHKLKYSRPTSRGSIVEDLGTSTPMHVGSKGALSFFPENQGAMLGKRGEVLKKGEQFPNISNP